MHLPHLFCIPTISVALLSLAPTSPCQEYPVGGGIELLAHFSNADWPASGAFSSIAPTGDLDGDGFEDLILGGISSAGHSYYKGYPGGAVIVSAKTGEPIRYLQGMDTSTLTYDGYAVAGGADVNADGVPDCIVGAPYAEHWWGGDNARGHATVFSGADGSILQFWEGEVKGQFGKSVALAGDINRDGYCDIVVGSPNEKLGAGSGPGAVFVYSGYDGSLLRLIEGEESGDDFGYRVAIVQNLDGDRVPDLLVVARHTHRDPIWNVGSVYAYSGETGDLLFKLTGDQSEQGFSMKACSAGDVDRDGIDDVLIGMPWIHRATVVSGATQKIIYRFKGIGSSSLFGLEIAGGEDVNGDGCSDFLISDPGRYLGGGELEGTVELYSGADGSLLHQWQGRNVFYPFGKYPSFVGDQNGDGLPEIAFCDNSDFYGVASVYSYQPFLYADRAQMSVTQGGRLNLSIQFPDQYRFHRYRILLSQSGTGPTDFGVFIPLTADNLFRQSARGDYPFHQSQGLQSKLNPDASASAWVRFPAGLPTSLIGTTLHFAAVAHHPHKRADVSSVAVPLRFEP